MNTTGLRSRSEVASRKTASLDTRLDLNAILIGEFEYIAQTAFHAEEDRARVTTYYLAAVGSLITALLTVQVEGAWQLAFYQAFTILFAMLSLVGLVTVLQLVRLRQAWFESIVAMDQIKEFYIEHCQGIVDLGEAIRWRLAGSPPRFKPWSLSFLLAVQVALLGGTTLGAAIVFAGLMFGAWWWPYALGAGILYCTAQLVVYWWLLQQRKA